MLPEIDITSCPDCGERIRYTAGHDCPVSGISRFTLLDAMRRCACCYELWPAHVRICLRCLLAWRRVETERV